MDETILFAGTIRSLGQEACAVDCQCGHYATAMFSVPWPVPSRASVFVLFLHSLLLRAVVFVFAVAVVGQTLPPTLESLISRHSSQLSGSIND